MLSSKYNPELGSDWTASIIPLKIGSSFLCIFSATFLWAHVKLRYVCNLYYSFDFILYFLDSTTSNTIALKRVTISPRGVSFFEVIASRPSQVHLAVLNFCYYSDF